MSGKKKLPVDRRVVQQPDYSVQQLEPRCLLSATLISPVPTQVVGASGSATVNLTTYFDDNAIPAGDTVVNIETNGGGSIPLELTTNATPDTVQNFLNYINSGEYANSIIHRSVPGFVIQGGGYTNNGSTIVTHGTIPSEASTETMGNTTGTIAMALSSGPNSATDEWFINLADNSSLLDGTSDGGPFTVFGQVIYNGLNVANEIAGLPIEDDTANGAWNTIPVINGTNGSTVSSVPAGDLVTLNPVIVPGGVDFSAQSANTNIVTTSITNGVLTITPATGVTSGTTTVTVTATDLNAGTATNTFSVVVSPHGDTITDVNGAVSVIGTTGSDTIAAGTNPSNTSQDYFLIETAGVGTVEQFFAKTSVTSVNILGDPVGSSPTGADNDYVNLGGDNFGFTVSVTGGKGADTVIGQQAPNFITTGIGSGDNVIYGGIGNDSLVSDSSFDTLRSGGGHDTISANTGNNVLVGGKDGSDLIAGTGWDTLRAGQGNSTLHGSHNTAAGTLMIGGFGNDYLNGTGSSNDTMIAGSGLETLIAGTGTYFMDAGWDSYLILQGGAALPTPNGSDSIAGSSGTLDTIVSSSGTPVILGSNTKNVWELNNPSASASHIQPGDFVAENDTVDPTGATTITINLRIIINGVDAIIPDGAGDTPTGTSAVRATSAGGTIVFQTDGSRTFTLADFFEHWGVAFNDVGVGQFVASANSGHTLIMTVNGTLNTQYQNYQVQNGDNIVISYTG